MDQKKLGVGSTPEERWRRLLSLEELDHADRKMIRIEGRQIAVFKSDSGEIHACNNRCPHQGYPLIEGHLDGCTLTCQWHNWKFDLTNGRNHYGGDALRTYPLERREDDLYIDLTPPAREVAIAERMVRLREAMTDASYDRMGRELARLLHLQVGPSDLVRAAISWTFDRFEFGWTHAYAGLADWLTLYDEAPDEETRLLCLTEALGHLADDTLRQPVYAFEDTRLSYSPDALLGAIEAQDDRNASALLNDALEQGHKLDDLDLVLSQAALRHYNDFGHSLIYLTKARALIARLGRPVAKPLLLNLVRSLCYATREDLIPEFRGYADALARWPKSTNSKEAASPPMAKDYWRRGLQPALELTLRGAHQIPAELHRTLLIAAARNVLGFDLNRQDRIRVPVSANVSWLDLTHALTFGLAVREQCSRYPELWPQGLLQMALFVGRNAPFLMAQPEPLAIDPAPTLIRQALEQVFDHGQGEYILSVHMLKTTLAVRELANDRDQWTNQCLASALNRYMKTPLPRRRPRRFAHQALKFIAADSD